MTREQKLHRNARRMDNVIFTCFTKPKGDELPQAVSQDDLIIDLLHDCTGIPHDAVSAELHHQLTE